jgi:hypothetical protein
LNEYWRNFHMLDMFFIFNTIFIWKLLLRQILFSIKWHSYRPVFFISNFQWFYTTSKFAKYIKSITKIIQVWLLCIWKVISLSLLCIIYKPVIVNCKTNVRAWQLYFTKQLRLKNNKVNVNYWYCMFCLHFVRNSLINCCLFSILE